MKLFGRKNKIKFRGSLLLMLREAAGEYVDAEMFDAVCEGYVRRKLIDGSLHIEELLPEYHKLKGPSV